MKIMGSPIVKYNQYLVKGLDMHIQHNWVYSMYIVMFINAPLVSTHSPLSLISIESNVDAQSCSMNAK